MRWLILYSVNEQKKKWEIIFLFLKINLDLENIHITLELCDLEFDSAWPQRSRMSTIQLYTVQCTFGKQIVFAVCDI